MITRIVTAQSLAAMFALFPVMSQTCPGADDTESHWNQFRGPRGDGTSVSGELPIEFDESHNVRWKTRIPDSGWSSPVVWENEIWVTAGSDKKKELRAICIDLETGKIKQDIKVFDMIERKVDPAFVYDSPHLNSPATPTSVVEEDRVFVSFGSQGLACLDRNTGNRIWQRRDLRIYQPVRQGSSPIVDDRNLYVAFDGNDRQFFVALDKATGETRWKKDRNIATDWSATLRASGIAPKEVANKKPGDNKKSFATAMLIEVDGQRQLIAPAAEATIAYAPETGKEIWRVLHPGGFNVSARPIYANGLVYVFTSGLTGYLMGIRPDGTGDVTETHVAWSTTRSTPRIPSPVILDDLLFTVTDKGGVARCLNARTGEHIWTERLGGDHWASPLLSNGRIYFADKTGAITVITAGREFDRLARNTLKARFIASPAVLGNSLILRSTTHLYCLTNGYKRSDQQLAADIYPDSGNIRKSDGKAASRADRVQALSARLKALVRSRTLTEEEALELLQTVQGQK
ncbi:MAG: PQQ-binding-like beta-propeller repeat protein [Planctomycetaceae bacterium]